MTIKITLASGAIENTKADVLVVPVGLSKLASDPNIAALDRSLDGQLTAVCARAEFVGRTDQVCEIVTLGRIASTRLVLIGTGEQVPDTAAMRHIAACAARIASGSAAATLAFVIPWKLEAAELRPVAEGLVLGAYRFDRYFT
ncbi:MAG TPA: M17 family peptidase N-terminal domain-containing protein, partial [Polyangiaceae bacterium]